MSPDEGLVTIEQQVLPWEENHPYPRWAGLSTGF